jgi:hypothetical protein
MGNQNNPNFAMARRDNNNESSSDESSSEESGKHFARVFNFFNRIRRR